MTITDAAMPDIDWTGGTAWYRGDRVWWCSTGDILDYDTSTKTITIEGLVNSAKLQATADDDYYLCNKLEALDSEREWYYDESSSQLYLWAPGGVDPSSLTVEAKERVNAFDLSGKSYIDIKDIEIFASTVDTDAATSYITMDGLDVKYVSHYLKLEGNAGSQSEGGIVLEGHHITLKNSEIAYSSASGIRLAGPDNQIINNYLHDLNYSGSNNGAIDTNSTLDASDENIITASNNVISHNTIKRTGRASIRFNYLTDSLIQYNDLSEGNYLTRDVGLIYTVQSDGGNTEIRYNKLYDNMSDHFGHGMYFDNHTKNYIVHHNLVYNVEMNAFNLNQYDSYTLVYNNTGVNDFASIWAPWPDQNAYKDRYANNVSTGIFDMALGSVTEDHPTLMANYDNITLHDDFTLPTGSVAIDRGIEIEGITTDADSSGVDAGAFEYGVQPWKAGHDFANPPMVIDTVRSQPLYRNRILNPGFEQGENGYWQVTSGNVDNFGNFTNHTQQDNINMPGSRGLRLGGGTAAIEQVITGLTPNTTYELRGWLRAQPGETGYISVKDYGGNEIQSTQVTDTVTGFEDSFESGLGNWSVVSGAPNTSSTQVYDGDMSLSPSGGMIMKDMQDETLGYVTIDFYDDASDTDLFSYAFLEDYEGGQFGLGVNTAISTTHYSRLINGIWSVTTVARSDGWHEFKWDISNGWDCKLYIDEAIHINRVGTVASTKDYRKIYIGDDNGNDTGQVFFDDVMTMNVKFSDSFEDGFDNWKTIYGTPSVSTSTLYNGSNAYFPDEEQDEIYHEFEDEYNYGIVSVWFYDDHLDTDIRTRAFLQDYDGNKAMVGVDSLQSTQNYAYQTDGSWKVSSVARTTGWHEFRWDVTNKSECRLYIDGTYIGSTGNMDGFFKMFLGDNSLNGTGNVYFDKVLYAQSRKAWVDRKVSFTTGASNTSATIVITKDSTGGNYLFADEFGLVYSDLEPTAPPAPSPLPMESFDEDFENGFGEWSTIHGTPTTSSSVKYNGGYSYSVDEDKDEILHNMSSESYGIVTMMFYDAATDTDIRTRAILQDGSGARVGLGVNTPTSTTHYVYLDGTNWFTGIVPRTTGWHELKWDMSSGVDCKLYIDDVYIGRTFDMRSFLRIYIGDNGTNNTGNVYFDKVRVNAPVLKFEESFENDFSRWNVNYGTPTGSSAEAYDGPTSYSVDEDQDEIWYDMTSNTDGIVRMMFYDDATDTDMKTRAILQDGNGTRLGLAVVTGTSTANYVYMDGSVNIETTAARSTGWHEFKWDMSSGVDCKIYIDGNLVATNTQMKDFTRIYLGDNAAGKTGNVYFDNIEVE